MDKTLIERAIESAKNRQYKLSADLERNISEKHRTKAEKQKEVAEVTVMALERMIPKKPMPIITELNEYICTICSCCQYVAVDINDKYCKHCGQRLDWGE